MDYLNQFELPIQSMQNGLHHYSFEIGQDFFGCFEESSIEKGNYRTELVVDKRDNEFLLNFNITGFFQGPCDRCLAEIDIPTDISKMIWVKYSEEKAGMDFDEDVIYIDGNLAGFNVGSLIHELIVLSTPMVKRYDCENDPEPKCDFKVLSFLDQESAESEKNDLWDQLKNISES